MIKKFFLRNKRKSVSSCQKKSQVVQKLLDPRREKLARARWNAERDRKKNRTAWKENPAGPLDAKKGGKRGSASAWNRSRRLRRRGKRKGGRETLKEILSRLRRCFSELLRGEHPPMRKTGHRQNKGSHIRKRRALELGKRVSSTPGTRKKKKKKGGCERKEGTPDRGGVILKERLSTQREALP